MTWPTRRSMMAAAVLGAILLAASLLTGGNDDTPSIAAPGARAARGADIEVSDLKLELLQQGRAELTPPERDPFRFQARPEPPRPAVPAPRVAAAPAAPVLAAPPVPAGPPPPPPIPLKFIGIVEAPTQGGRVAILSDGRGNVLYGKEGDTIEGRYRLLRVATDSVELAYVDGKGRQTVRLAGQ